MSILTAHIFGTLFIIWFLCGCALTSGKIIPCEKEFYRLRDVPYDTTHDCKWKAQEYFYFLKAKGYDVKYVRGYYWNEKTQEEIGHAWVEDENGNIYDPTGEGIKEWYTPKNYNQFSMIVVNLEKK